MGALADEYIRVRADTSKVPGDVRKAGARAGSDFQSSFASSMRSKLKGGLIGVGVAAGALFGAALKKGFARLSAIEEATAKLDGLGHSAKTVELIMKNALASVKDTAFGLDEAATVAATAVAAGVKPGKDLQRTLGLVADAATIGGDSLAGMGAIFADVAASNKIQGDTINQLNQRGIPILKLLADVTGKSQAEVRELASKGKIDFATFQKAMEQGLGGAALKSGNTASGAFKNMGAAFSRVGAALLKDVFPRIGAGINGITDWLDDITPIAERIGKSWGKMLQSDAFKTAVADLKTAVEGLTGNEDLVKSLEDMAGALPKIVSGLATAITKYTEFANLVDKFENQTFAEGDKVGGPVGQIVKDFGAGGTIETALIQFRGFAARHIKAAWATVKQAFAADVAGIVAGVGQFKDRVIAIVSALGRGIKTAAWNMTLPIRVAMTAIGTIMVLGWMAIRKPVLAAFNFIKNQVILPAWAAIVGRFRSAMATIRGAWTGFWTVLRTIVSAAWTKIRATISAAWNHIYRGIILPIWNRIRGSWTSNQTGVSSSWSSFWGRVKNTASTAIEWVRSKITTVLDKIKTAFSTAKTNIGRVWDGIKTVVQKPINWIKDNVYNTPLVPVWNRVADLVSGPKLNTFSRGGIAGVLPGYSPGHDKYPIMAGGGEAIMRPEWTRAVGKDWVDKANKAARTGKKSLHDFLGESAPVGEGGGIGWLKGIVSGATGAVGNLAGKLKDWALGGLHALAEKIISPVKNAMDGAMPNSGVGKTVGGIGKKAFDLVLDKIKEMDIVPGLGGPAGSAIASGGWASIYKILRAAGARSFTTYAGHDQGASRSRDIWPPSQAIAEAARRLSSIWYVIYNRRIASITYGRRWRAYNGSNPHTDHVHVTLRPGVRAAMGGIVGDSLAGKGLLNGGIVKGGRGGINAVIGEGKRDELVAPLPRGWNAAGGGKSKEAGRPLKIELKFGEDFRYYVEGLIDDRDQFHATMGRLS